MIINNSEYVRSCTSKSNYPNSLDKIELAFVGRSNVGKSSLINSLLNRKNLARTSKTPGRTQLINFFKVNNERYIVDLPGYGFAKVPTSIKQKWGDIISEYLQADRKKIVFLLLDIRRIPNEDDFEMLRYLENYDIEYYIVFTKIDKLSNNERFNQLRKIKEKLIFKNEDVFFHSSLKKIGNKEILEYIDKIEGR